MACTLTAGGMTIDCINSKGGIKTLYIGNFEDLDTYTVLAGAVTAMDMVTTKQLWTYNLEKQNAAFVQSAKKDIDAGTLYYELKYDWNAKKMSLANQVQLTTMMQQRLIVIHLDSNGNYWVGGLVNGADMMVNDASSGKTFAELNGYTMSITGMEPDMVYSISKTIVDTLIVPAV